MAMVTCDIFSAVYFGWFITLFCFVGILLLLKKEKDELKDKQISNECTMGRLEKSIDSLKGQVICGFKGHGWRFSGINDKEHWYISGPNAHFKCLYCDLKYDKYVEKLNAAEKKLVDSALNAKAKS